MPHVRPTPARGGLMVAAGTLISTFWILASNSFMQTPQGFAMESGRLVPVDWMKVIFNPSFPYRLAHMTIAAFIVAGFIVAACGAWHLLQGRRDAPVTRSFSMALWILLLLTPVQIFVGDAHGLNTREYQPAKIAAIEGLWETEKGGTALNLVGLPDMNAEVTRYTLQVPHLGSLILTHSWDGEIRGLKDVHEKGTCATGRSSYPHWDLHCGIATIVEAAPETAAETARFEIRVLSFPLLRTMPRRRAPTLRIVRLTSIRSPHEASSRRWRLAQADATDHCIQVSKGSNSCLKINPFSFSAQANSAWPSCAVSRAVPRNNVLCR